MDHISTISYGYIYQSEPQFRSSTHQKVNSWESNSNNEFERRSIMIKSLNRTIVLALSHLVLFTIRWIFAGPTVKSSCLTIKANIKPDKDSTMIKRQNCHWVHDLDSLWMYYCWRSSESNFWSRLLGIDSCVWTKLFCPYDLWYIFYMM